MALLTLCILNQYCLILFVAMCLPYICFWWGARFDFQLLSVLKPS